jgi:hypothetical protein
MGIYGRERREREKGKWGESKRVEEEEVWKRKREAC